MTTRATIDAILGYDDSLVTNEQRQSQAISDENETVDGRWRYIEHTETHTRVMIRLQRQMFAVPEEVRIAGVIYLPWRPGDPITSQLLRELPIARIEAAINKRLFAMKRTETITGGKIVLPPATSSASVTCSSRSATRRRRPTSTSWSPSARPPDPGGRPQPERDDGADQRRRALDRAGVGDQGPGSWTVAARAARAGRVVNGEGVKLDQPLPRAGP
jgi:hypothetical protein